LIKVHDLGARGSRFRVDLGAEGAEAQGLGKFMISGQRLKVQGFGCHSVAISIHLIVSLTYN